MRIAFIVHVFPKLSETFILDQITGLIDRGHEVDIFAAYQENISTQHKEIKNYSLLERTYYPKPVPKTRLRRYISKFELLKNHIFINPGVCLRSLNLFRYGKKAATLTLLNEAISFFSSSQYDIIHCHFGHRGVLGAVLREVGSLQGKLVTTFHGYDLSVFLRKVGRHYYDRLFADGDLFLPISEYWKSHLIELGCKPEKIAVHRMGIDLDKFVFKPRILSGDETVQFVSIARLVDKKGIEYAIRAVAKLVKKNIRIKYIIIGDGPLKGFLQSLIKKLGILHVVDMMGWKSQQDVIKILEKAHILIAPSVTAADGDMEGIPVSLMEGMAVGLPIISTQHSGIPELVRDGVTGFLVPEKNVEQLYLRMEYLIQNPSIFTEFGLRGRNHVLKNYNLNILNDELVNLYQNLIG